MYLIADCFPVAVMGIELMSQSVIDVENRGRKGLVGIGLFSQMTVVVKLSGESDAWWAGKMKPTFVPGRTNAG